MNKIFKKPWHPFAFISGLFFITCLSVGGWISALSVYLTVIFAALAAMFWWEFREGPSIEEIEAKLRERGMSGFIEACEHKTGEAILAHHSAFHDKDELYWATLCARAHGKKLTIV